MKKLQSLDTPKTKSEMGLQSHFHLNGRPPAPKAGALTSLRYAPIFRIPITRNQAPNKFQ